MRRSPGSTVSLLWKKSKTAGRSQYRSESVPALDSLEHSFWDYLCSVEIRSPKRNIMAIVMEIVPTVRHTTATDMAVGTMGIIIGMAASLVVIMVVEV